MPKRVLPVQLRAPSSAGEPWLLEDPALGNPTPGLYTWASGSSSNGHGAGGREAVQGPLVAVFAS